MVKESYVIVFVVIIVDDVFKWLNKVCWLMFICNGSMGVEGLNMLIYDVIKYNIVCWEGSFY